MHFKIKKIDDRIDPLRDKFIQIKNKELPLAALGEVLTKDEIHYDSWCGNTFFMHILQWMPNYAKEALEMFYQSESKEMFNLSHTNEYGSTVLNIALYGGYQNFIHTILSEKEQYVAIVYPFLADILAKNMALFMEINDKYHIDNLSYVSEEGMSCLDVAISEDLTAIDYVLNKSSSAIIQSSIEKIANGTIEVAHSPNDPYNDYDPPKEEVLTKLQQFIPIQEKKQLETLVSSIVNESKGVKI